jgi:hypothetical protein
MSQDFIEAILRWSAEGPDETVNEWFTSRGFGVTPMRVGLLVTGDRDLFERELRMDSARPDSQTKLAVPAALSKHVASITVPQLRQPHS